MIVFPRFGHTVKLILFILLSVCRTANSQTKDAAFWENIFLEKKIATNWTLHLNQEGRINQNISRFYYIYGDFGTTYRVNKHIRLMFDYVLAEKKVKSDIWSTRHQFYFAAQFRQKLG